MSGLSFGVEPGATEVVLRVSGVLDAYSAPELRAALLSCVADQPAAVILDGSALTIGDEIGLIVLAGVAEESWRWPGTRLAVAGGPELQAAALRMGVGLHLPVCPDRATAVRALGPLAVPPTSRHRITADRDAPSLARAAVVAFCTDQGVGGDGDAAQLVASELVTNAVVHAGTEIQLTLRLIAPFLHIAVRDGGAGRPRIASLVDESSDSGRGLLLVDALAASWGTFVPDTGKVVWAQVRVRPTSSNAL